VTRWNEIGWFRPQPRRPPPAHGIKMKTTGTTWWGQRWIEALAVVLCGDTKRLARGKSYARAGRTHDLVIQGGEVTAKVTGSRATPYRVTIEVTQLPEAAWTKAIAGMARQAQFAAELLAGQMPKEIAEVFRAAGTHLFPATPADLVTSCTCPDWGDPCKHVAATHYVLGEALDRDPFLLFDLRGRTKAQVLDALRLARLGDAGTPPPRRAAAKAAASREHEIPKVTLARLDPSAYDRPREDLPALPLSFDEPETHGAILVQLGAPAAWQSGDSPARLLTPLVRAAAARARSIALAEPEPEAEPASAPKTDPIAARPSTRRPRQPRSTVPATMRATAPAAARATAPAKPRTTKLTRRRSAARRRVP
jgi:uncharacterized Zn finger protein